MAHPSRAVIGALVGLLVAISCYAAAVAPFGRNTEAAACEPGPCVAYREWSVATMALGGLLGENWRYLNSRTRATIATFATVTGTSVGLIVSVDPRRRRARLDQ